MWNRWKYEILLVTTVVVWGLNFPVIKAALAVMHPHVLNAFRFTISFVVLALVYVWETRRLGKSLFGPYRTRGGSIITLGLFGFVVYQLFFIVGVNKTTAGTAALIMASAPVWTAVAGRLFGLEHLRLAAWFGLFVTLAGTVTIIIAGSKAVSLSSQVLSGNMLILGASVCWGFYTALSKPVLQHVSPSGLSFLGLVPALPILYVISMPFFPGVDWPSVSVWVWLAILFSGALSSGLAFITWSIAVKNLGSSHTAAFGNMVPVVALATGYYLLGETVTVIQLVGGAVVLAGLYVMRRARLRELAANVRASGV